MPQQSLIAVSPVSQDLLFTPDAAFDIGKNGATRPRNGYYSGVVVVGSGAAFVVDARSKIKSPSDNIFTLFNNAETDFNRLQFGGTTNAFPAFKRSGINLQARLADDTGWAGFDVAIITTRTSYTAATLPASTLGARAMVNDSSVAAAGNFGNIVAGGGANVVPVWADGANWRIG